MDELKAASLGAGAPASVSRVASRSDTVVSKPAGKPEKIENSIDIEAAVKEMNNYAAEHDINLSFSVHKPTGKTVIKIVDSTTKEVVRQMPPEELLKQMAMIEEMAGHILSAKI